MSSRTDREVALSEQTMRVEGCSMCDYSSERKRPVFGSGDSRSPIVVLGELCREVDDQKGEIFSGKAGGVLDRLLRGAGINPARVYRTYTIKCYGGQKPETPATKAARICAHQHLRAQLTTLKPRVVLLAGWRNLNWLLLQWADSTRQVDENTFQTYMDRAIVFRELWGEIRFFVIDNPTLLAHKPNPAGFARSAEVINYVKAYVESTFKGPVIVPDTLELKSPPKTRPTQKVFDFSPPKVETSENPVAPPSDPA